MTTDTVHPKPTVLRVFPPPIVSYRPIPVVNLRVVIEAFVNKDDPEKYESEITEIGTWLNGLVGY